MQNIVWSILLLAFTIDFLRRSLTNPENTTLSNKQENLAFNNINIENEISNLSN